MLDVMYEAVVDLPPGRLAKIDENRGRIRVQVDGTAPLADVVRQLNIEIDRLLGGSDWFQLWDDAIISRNTPVSSLRVEYLLEKKEDFEEFPAHIEERRGLVSVYIDPDLETADFAAAMNPATEKFLAGGQWFQLYAGEIIDNSPESTQV